MAKPTSAKIYAILMEARRRGVDPYNAVASHLFNIGPRRVNTDQREKAKRLLLSSAYTHLYKIAQGDAAELEYRRLSRKSADLKRP